MRGIGSASGAITFVNALPTGVGASAAIALSARAELELSPSVKDASASTLEMIDGEPTPLVAASFRVGVERFAKERSWSGRLRLASDIPLARGLKSSSAVSVAILRSVARATGRELDDVESARVSAELSQEIGVSATGAFDDALACAGGGLAITDNTSRRVLKRTRLPSSLQVLLWIPPGTHAPSPGWKEAFESRAPEGQAVVDALLGGDLFEAMERNGLLVESVMGYDYAEIRRRLKDAGAVASGVSGLGPTLAAILPVERLTEGRSVLTGKPGRLLLTRFRAAGEVHGGSE